MKQIGHSAAFLYRNTSMRWPFTYISFGSCISCGTMSVCELFRDDVVRAASVLARPRKKGDDEGEAAMGEVGDGSEKAGCDGERFMDRSEFDDMDRDVMGTVRLLMLVPEARGFHAGLRFVDREGSSGGTSSGAGSARPFTTATS
jgi:hypothetical protein